MSTNSAPWERPLDQWKVTELKEELKRRKLITRGLKEELVRRLDEALRKEAAEATDVGNGFNLQDEPLVGSKDIEVKDEGHAKPNDCGEPLVKDVKKENVHMVDVNDSCVSFLAQDGKVGNLKLLDSVNQNADETAGVTDCGLGVDKGPSSAISNPSLDAKIEASIPEGKKPIYSTATSQVSEIMPEHKHLSAAEPTDEAPITEESQTASEPIPQVSESVHQVVKCESVSTDSVSIKQENTLKDNLITDNVPVEPEIVKEEVPQSLSSHDAGEHGASVTDVEGGVESAAKCGDVSHDMDVDSFEKGDANICAHGSVVEKPVQEKVTESKRSDITLADDDENKDVNIQESIAVEEKIESATATIQINMEEKYEFVGSIENSTQLAEKRKFGTDVEVEHEPPKRQRKWNSDHELAKVSAARPSRLDKENFADATQTSSPVAASNLHLLSPRDKTQGVKLSRTDSNIDSDAPKERVVPPPQRSPTTSLRIDKFLRPFTLKAVQELLAKTGTVGSFWMDHIKTHCYVTYSSVDEAVATRDALYNLQWPPNGGRLLTAEFVEPEDVKLRVEGGSQSPTTVSQPTLPPQSNQVNPNASTKLPPVVLPSPKQPLPPPPPLTPQARPQHVGRERLPPPPPTRKVEAPVVTLDDLFKKTRATPRIYYLPLSEEQVAAKLASTGADGRDKAADSWL
ncbi:unnamed protein product [Victoria cruziana]